MKTPRDLLFEQHQDAKSKLDAISSEVVARSREEQHDAIPKLRISGLSNFALLLWRELILPSRRVWAGLAAAWVLILAVNFALRDPALAGKAKVSAPVMMSFQEQQKLLNELLVDRSLPDDVDRPKSFLPRPRSERIVVVMT